MLSRQACGAMLVLALAAVGLGMERRAAPPTFVAVGGALSDDNEDVYRQLLARRDTDKIVIVPYASADAAAASKSTIERFKKYRPDATYLVLPDATKDAESKKLAAEWIAHADLVFFTGGDQSRLIPRFYDGDRPNAVLEALREGMLKWGTVVGGTSAGCACLSDPMFTGGGSEAALGGAEKAGKEDAEEPPMPARPASPRSGRGLGLIPGVIMDSHFAQRGRVGRMVAALEKSGVRFGIGVNEDRAVLVQGNIFRAIGGSAAIVVDAGRLTREGSARLNARVWLLADHDEFTLPADRQNPPAVACGDQTPAGIPASWQLVDALNVSSAGAWDKNVMLALLLKLAADPKSVQRADSERFEVTISADEETRFAAHEGASVSVLSARMDIREKSAVPESPPPVPQH